MEYFIPFRLLGTSESPAYLDAQTKQIQPTDSNKTARDRYNCFYIADNSHRPQELPTIRAYSTLRIDSVEPASHARYIHSTAWQKWAQRMNYSPALRLTPQACETSSSRLLPSMISARIPKTGKWHIQAKAYCRDTISGLPTNYTMTSDNRLHGKDPSIRILKGKLCSPAAPFALSR